MRTLGNGMTLLPPWKPGFETMTGIPTLLHGTQDITQVLGGFNQRRRCSGGGGWFIGKMMV